MHHDICNNYLQLEVHQASLKTSMFAMPGRQILRSCSYEAWIQSVPILFALQILVLRSISCGGNRSSDTGEPKSIKPWMVLEEIYITYDGDSIVYEVRFE